MDVSSFVNEDDTQIPLYLFGSSTDPLLNMDVIISLQGDSAAREFSRHRFRKSKNISKTFLGEYLIISFEIRSYPSDLLVFILPISPVNSVIVKGEFKISHGS